jgi:hypothetical protein
MGNPGYEDGKRKGRSEMLQEVRSFIAFGHLRSLVNHMVEDDALAYAVQEIRRKLDEKLGEENACKKVQP